MRRFVLLLHELPATSQRATHYDLMLAKGLGNGGTPPSADAASIASDSQNEKTLWTWEVARDLESWLASSTTSDAPQSLMANPLPLHRAAYMFYEGPVTDGRGRVLRIDMGEYEVIGDDSLLEGIHQAGKPNVVRLKLYGQKLNGEFELFWQQDQWYLRRV